jgi:hypothetical protein
MEKNMKRKILIYIFLFAAIFLIVAELTNNINNQVKSRPADENYIKKDIEVNEDSLEQKSNDPVWEDTEFIED